ncbi:hypothetical protein [Flagellimonas sp. GZD32]|uniref:hypothetical protein n=1 Tax=Flagellimonas cixiensis TaxID=3228750 RepID=UPI0035C899C4
MEEQSTIETTIEKLYSGYAIAIDENINTPESDDRILDIVKQIEDEGIPLVKYDAIPKNKNFIKNIKSVSFFILDWELNPSDKGEPHSEEQVELQLGDALKDSSFEDNVKFIESIKENCFAPVFIFTELDPGTVIEELLKSEKNLYNVEDESKNFILIRKKGDITGKNQMFESISDWINSNPSIYTLKKWEENFYKAKNSTFLELYSSSPVWPTVLWEAFNEDSVHEGLSIDEIIYRNIKGRGPLLELNPEIVNNGKKDEAPSPEEIKSLVVNSQFVFNNSIPANDLRPGDIFYAEKKNEFYINIRPICDTVIGREKCDGYAYCLKGAKASNSSISRNFKEKYGYISQRDNEYIVFGIEGSKFVSFSFNSLIQIPFNEIVDKRVQRLLPPHITNLQQKYSGYIGRVGLPRTFKEIIPVIEEQG